MTIPEPISDFLAHHHVDYSILKHKPAQGGLDIAQIAAIPLQQLVYSVVLQHPQQTEQLLLVLIPASHHLDMDKLTQALGQPYQIINRQDLKSVFDDCQPGVIPGLGQPFDLDTLIDIRLFQIPQLYLEDGDNTELIKLNQSQFSTLMDSCPRYDLCSNSTKRVAFN